MCDSDDEINVPECFQKFTDEDMWQLFAEQTNIQGVTGGTDQTSGECSLSQTIPI